MMKCLLIDLLNLLKDELMHPYQERVHANMESPFHWE
jgi:hypothetical protein